VLVCDIDHFKRVNDTYGHDVGDIVIKALGAVHQREKRVTDAVARFGLAVCAERWPEAWACWDRPESAMGALRRLSWSQLRAGVDAHARAAASGRPVPVVGGPADWARAHGVPVWWVAPLHAAWGDALPAFLEAQRRRPPLWVRLTRPDAAASLAAEGFSVRPDGSGAAVVVGSRPIHGTAAWRAGAMEVQDRASLEVGAQVPIAPGDRVWDACAGEGGTAIADCSRMPRVRASAWRITWSRRSRQASVTPSITWMNDGMPWRGSGGLWFVESWASFSAPWDLADSPRRPSSFLSPLPLSF
jgi:hypothetical protein